MSSCKYRLTHAPDHSKPHFLFCSNNFHYCQHSQYHILRIFSSSYILVWQKKIICMKWTDAKVVFAPCYIVHIGFHPNPNDKWREMGAQSREILEILATLVCTCEKKREAKKPRQQSDREKETLRAHIYANSQSVEPIEPASTAHRTLKNERAKKQSQKSARCIKLGAQHITRRRRRVSKKAAAAAWPCRERLWREA